MTADAWASVHASAVVIRERGVAIRGPSGSGKSSLALMLIEAAERRGWFARLVGDDRLIVSRFGGAVVAAPHPAVAGLIERRTGPILRVPHEPRCRVGLLVDLAPPDAPLPRLPEPDASVPDDPAWGGTPLLRLQGPPSPLGCGMVLDRLAAL